MSTTKRYASDFLEALQDETDLEEWDGQTPAEDSFARFTGSSDNEELVLAAFDQDGLKVRRLSPGDVVGMGRSPRCVLNVVDHSLSRHHAEFRYDGERLVVRDLHSTNGTRVNGNEIGQAGPSRTRCLPHQLEVGDVVVAGNTVVCVYPAGAFESDGVGLDSHDGFVAEVTREVERARTFSRSLALLMFSSMQQTKDHLSLWYPMLRHRLRNVDRVALFGPCTAEVMIVETDLQEVFQFAQRILNDASMRGIHLCCGIAMLPNNGNDADELFEVTQEALSRATPERPIEMGREMEETSQFHLKPATPHAEPIIRSRQMERVHRFASNVAQSDVPVLIAGPAGCGKKVIAQQIHRRSARSEGPLIVLSCASLPAEQSERVLFGHVDLNSGQVKPGIFERAKRGTLVLDGVDQLSEVAQRGLAHVVEQRCVTPVGGQSIVEVDVRLVVTTAENLLNRCAKGSFLPRLYSRLAGATIAIPPLYRRQDEIISLADHFITLSNRANQQHVAGLDARVKDALCKYHWPGNVRQLRNVIERAVAAAHGETIMLVDLPADIAAAADPRHRMTHADQPTRRTRAHRSGGQVPLSEGYDSEPLTALLSADSDVDEDETLVGRLIDFAENFGNN